MTETNPIKILRGAEKEIAYGLPSLSDEHPAAVLIRRVLPMTNKMRITDIVVGDKGDPWITVWISDGRDVSEHEILKSSVKQTMKSLILESLRQHENTVVSAEPVKLFRPEEVIRAALRYLDIRVYDNDVIQRAYVNPISGNVNLTVARVGPGALVSETIHVLPLSFFTAFEAWQHMEGAYQAARVAFDAEIKNANGFDK